MGRGDHRSKDPRTLAPTLGDRLVTRLRGSGWSRPFMIRRLVAAVLVLLAAALVVRPEPGTTVVLVAGRDLVPGSTLRATDLERRALPAELVPAGAITELSDVDGRVLASAVRRGEPITDVAVLSNELTKLLAAGEDAATVPVRLSDPDVAGLLSSGATVDVIGLGERGGQPTVLAERATVAAVLDNAAPVGLPAGRDERGRLVVVILPRDAATRVAAASLAQSLTVTVR
jgi:pilus assembly protein CpaB